MGVRRVYGLLDSLLKVGGVGGGEPRECGSRVLEYLQRTFLGTSSLALLLFFCCNLIVGLSVKGTHIHSDILN